MLKMDYFFLKDISIYAVVTIPFMMSIIIFLLRFKVSKMFWGQVMSFGIITNRIVII